CDRPAMRDLLPLLAALCLLMGCAAGPTRPEGALEPSTPAALDALYQRVEAAAQTFADAGQQGDAGDDARDSARLDLQALAARCAALAGCSSARVFGVYDRLLASQGQA